MDRSLEPRVVREDGSSVTFGGRTDHLPNLVGEKMRSKDTKIHDEGIAKKKFQWFAFFFNKAHFEKLCEEEDDRYDQCDHKNTHGRQHIYCRLRYIMYS